MFLVIKKSTATPSIFLKKKDHSLLSISGCKSLPSSLLVPANISLILNFIRSAVFSKSIATKEPPCTKPTILLFDFFIASSASSSVFAFFIISSYIGFTLSNTPFATVSGSPLKRPIEISIVGFILSSRNFSLSKSDIFYPLNLYIYVLLHILHYF